MGMQVVPLTEGGERSPCACLVPASPVGPGKKFVHRMNLPSPVEFSNIEIENAHTPLPPGGSGSSPTHEVTPQSPRQEHSGRCLITLKRKGSTDIVRQTHVRSASVRSLTSGGGCSSRSFGGTSPEELSPPDIFADPNGNRSLSSPAPSPSPRPCDSSRGCGSGGGGGSGRRGSWGGNVSTIVSLEDAAQRIAVDPVTGHSCFVERPTVCDACPYCDDVCEVAWCSSCDERRAQLVDAYGALLEPKCSNSNDIGKDGTIIDSDIEGRKLGPALSWRYSRKSSYTLCEVRRRKLTGACWIVCQSSVYDVTGALADHPGGKRSVLRNAGGRDCEEDFYFHSKAAKKQWRQYRIGSLVACSGECGGEGERSIRTGSDCVIC